MDRQCSDSPPIFVVVVESHSHALEHYHTVIRHRRRKKKWHPFTSQWAMIHFDAHPDLACPGSNIPAAACFSPRKAWPAHMPAGDRVTEDGETNSRTTVNDQQSHDLYELLDASESGIAEWILPLVMAGDLSSVHWIRGQESNQLPLGRCSFQVGAWTPLNDDVTNVSSFLDLPLSATLKVDLNHPYYLDDSSIVPSCELMLSQPLCLTVSDLSTLGTDDHASAFSPTTRGVDWALDICLDYFACLNPFLTDLEEHDPGFTKAFVEVVYNTKIYQNGTDSFGIQEHDETNKGLTLQAYEDDLLTFRNLLTKTLLYVADSKSSDVPCGLAEEFEALACLFESKRQGELLLRALFLALSESNISSELATMAVEAIPNIMMPHCPADISVMRQSVSDQLSAASKFISESRSKLGRDPFIITIARSSADGFTPGSIVEELQTELLCRLHSLSCGCGKATLSKGNVDPEIFSQDERSCKWRLIFDYGEWEGSSFEPD